MPINISNVTDVLNSKNASANGQSTSAVELGRLALLANTVNSLAGVLTYSANTEFPAASVSNAGNIVFDASANTFYFSTGSDWSSLSLAAAASATQAQGSNYGYTSGGNPSYSNVIDKFSFSTDGNATDVGDLTAAKYGLAGQSSSDYGYTSGGQINGSETNVIEKFPFATDANSSDVGDLTVARRLLTGQSSTDNGYASGGYSNAPGIGSSNIIDKFSFATDGNATDVGDLTVTKYYVTGQSSSEYGYNSGGSTPSTTNVIEKFPFATDANSSDVGDLTVANASTAGQNSADYGYNSGGSTPSSTPSTTNVIDKFPFASDADATDVGDLTVGRYGPTGQSSTDYGYTSGGNPGPLNVIDKFPFSSDGNASDVGDITVGRYRVAGQQY
jgi:hypothetical protein